MTTTKAPNMETDIERHIECMRNKTGQFNSKNIFSLKRWRDVLLKKSQKPYLLPWGSVVSSPLRPEKTKSHRGNHERKIREPGMRYWHALFPPSLSVHCIHDPLGASVCKHALSVQLNLAKTDHASQEQTLGGKKADYCEPPRHVVLCIKYNQSQK